MLFQEHIQLKIFIAGASGMVGSAIFRAFTEKYSKKDSPKIKLLIPSRKQLDLTSYSQVEDWFKQNKPDIVINAAGKVGGIYANNKQPTEFILENLKIQTNLIEISKIYEVQKLLFIGSSCIYPKFAKQPIREEFLLNGALETTNEYYAISKISGIKLCEALRKQYGFNAICLMPTNLYGPKDNYHDLNSHVMPALIKKINHAKKNNLKSITCWGTGTPLREFLYVEDLADACIFALNNWNPNDINAPKNSAGVPLSWLNVGSQYEISIKDLVEKITNIIGFKGAIKWDNTKPDGTPRKKLDTSKMEELGWSAKTNLDKGIKLTIQSYQKEIEENTLRI